MFDNSIFKVQPAKQTKTNHRRGGHEHDTLQKPSRDIKAFYDFHNVLKKKCLFLEISNSCKAWPPRFLKISSNLGGHV